VINLPRRARDLGSVLRSWKDIVAFKPILDRVQLIPKSGAYRVCLPGKYVQM
jgi:hypothetical protein